MRGAGLYVRRVAEDTTVRRNREKAEEEIRSIVDRVAPEGKLNAKALSNLTHTVDTLAKEAPGDVDPLEVLALILEEYDLEE